MRSKELVSLTASFLLVFGCAERSPRTNTDTPPAPSTVIELACGNERITASAAKPGMRVTVGGQTLDMQRVVSASGAKYEVPGDSSTSFWNHGSHAILVVKGKTFPECTQAPGGDAGAGLAGLWVATEITGVPAAEGSRVTMDFREGRLAGNASCNSYSAPYTINGDRVSISGAIATRKACAAELMKQEDAFLKVLGAIERYEIDKAGRLRMHGAGKPLLVLRREK